MVEAPREEHPAENFAGFGLGMMAGLGYHTIEGAGGRVKAIGGRNAVRVNQFLEKPDIDLSDVEVIGEYTDILDHIASNPVADSVYVATIPALHLGQTVQAFMSGHNVLMEKGSIGGISEVSRSLERLLEAVSDRTLTINSHYRNHEVFDIHLKSLMEGKDIDENLLEVIGTQDIGRPLSMRVSYAQGYQGKPGDAIGWKAYIDQAGRFKILSDLGVHMLMTAMHVAGDGSKFVEFDGQTYNLHEKRMNSPSQTFTAEKAKKQKLEEIDMLDGEKHNGDDFAAGSFVLEAADGHRIPGTMYTSQVEGVGGVEYATLLTEAEKGNYGRLNALAVEVKFEGFTVTVRQKNPSVIEVTDPDGGNYREYERHSDPGPYTSPFQHPVGNMLAMQRGIKKARDTRAKGSEAIRAYNLAELGRILEADRVIRAWGANPLKPADQYVAPEMPRA